MAAPNPKHEALRKQVREAFIVFEHREGTRLLDIKEIPAALRACGVNPTNAQANLVQDQLAALNAQSDMSSLISLDHFENVVLNFLTQQEAALFRDDYFTLLRAFRAFDPEGRGWVDAEVLRTALSTKGSEPLSEEELTKMMGAAADESGHVYYEDYCQRAATDGRTM